MYYYILINTKTTKIMLTVGQKFTNGTATMTVKEAKEIETEKQNEMINEIEAGKLVTIYANDSSYTYSCVNHNGEKHLFMQSLNEKTHVSRCRKYATIEKLYASYKRISKA